jgi:hypothetical protein
MLAATGVLVRTATATVVFDDIAEAISDLRTGPALATPDLLCLHPATWTNIRTSKELQGRHCHVNATSQRHKQFGRE